MREAKHLYRLGVILFSVATLVSWAGAIVFKGPAQIIAWEFGEMAALAAYTVMSAILIKEHHDLVSAAFNLLIVGAGFFVSANASGNGDAKAYAAGLIIYFPGYILIGIYSRFQWWVRLCCFLLCIPFGFVAFAILNGTYSDPVVTLPNIAGYTIRTIIFIGWIIKLATTKEGGHIY